MEASGGSMPSGVEAEAAAASRGAGVIGISFFHPCVHDRRVTGLRCIKRRAPDRDYRDFFALSCFFFF